MQKGNALQQMLECNHCGKEIAIFLELGLPNHLNLYGVLDISFRSLYGVRVFGRKSANRHNRRGDCGSSRGRQARRQIREPGSGQDRFPPDK